MNQYREGLRHGYEDMGRMIQEVLELELPDAEKLARIGSMVASHATGAVIELPDEADR